MRQISRRRFVCFVAAGGASAGLLAALRQDPEGDTARQPGGSAKRVSRTSWALGSNVSITALHHDNAAGEVAIDAAFSEPLFNELVVAIAALRRTVPPKVVILAVEADSCLAGWLVK